MSQSDIWIMLTAIASAVPCAVLGCFLVLRRMSLLGDAITHAILPGLVLAFAITGSREVVPMLIGAGIAGMITALLSAALHRWGRVDEGAAMGVVFTALFALGVVLINIYARDVDLDPGCVLYGAIEYVPFDTILLGGAEVPRALVGLTVIGAIVLIMVAVFFKELKIVSFDPQLATTLGISAAFVHYGLLASVAATSVASFEAVGSVLVVTMLVAPAATAQLLTDRLSTMLALAAAIGALDAVAGHFLAVWMNTSVAGMMSTVAGAVFALAVVCSPQHGLLSRALRRTALRLRIAEEDILGILYRRSEGLESPVRTLSQPPALRRIAAWRLQRLGLLAPDRPSGTDRLTDRGLSAARSLVRSHRLWEAYLAKHSTLPLDHLHDPSERIEHFIDPQMQAQLAEEAGADRDPHGKDIPPQLP